MSAPWHPVEGGVRLAVKVTPKAGRASIIGLSEDGLGRALLCVRVPAPPVDGAANRTLIAFIAKETGVRKTDVSLLSGGAARVKMLRLAGDPATLTARLQTLLA